MKKLSLCLFAATSCLASTASAHAIVGDRVFPATIAVEDPGVSDELTLPQYSRFKAAGEDGAPNSWQTEISSEFSKRITENFALSLEGAWLDTSTGKGFDNLGLGAKYMFYKNPEHELMLSAGVDMDIGATGSRKIDAERYTSFTPTVYFGKGMGDLPDSVALLKPLAITGSLGYSMPTDSFGTDDTTGDKFRNANAVEWGLTLQYSMPYLQQHVRDLGLPSVINGAIPIVEFAFETPVNGEEANSTTGTINPGILFTSGGMQLGLEAQIPLNHDSGSGIGGMVQVHYYLDDLLPGLARPLW